MRNDAIVSAIFGACFGYLIAVIAYAMFIHAYPVGAARPSQLLDWALIAYEDNTAQKFFYAAAIIFGWLGARTVLRWFHLCYRPIAFETSISLFIVLTTYSIKLVTERHSIFWASLALICAFTVLFIGAVLMRRDTAITAVSTCLQPGSSQMTGATLAGLIVSALVLFIMFWPASMEAIAAGFQYNHHPVSFVIGPALYFKSSILLLPGRDYLPQYGIGIGWALSHFINDNIHSVLMNYAYLVVGGTIFYAISGLIVGRWLLGSTAWSLAAQIFIIVMMFHGYLHFMDGSSWPIRHPLLMVAIGLFMLAAQRFSSTSPQWLLGGVIGASIFWNTETGIYLIVATAGSFVLISGFTRDGWIAALRTVVVAILAMLTLSVIVYGRGALTMVFLHGLLLPIGIYTAGFGGAVQNWNPGWGYLYNIMLPLLSVATIAWATGSGFGSIKNTTEVAVRAGLTICAAVGLALLFKWINRAGDGIFLDNADTVVLVAAYWIKQAYETLLRSKYRTFFGVMSMPPVLLASLLIAAATTVLFRIHDPRGPVALAASSYMNYPSLLRSALSRQSPDLVSWGDSGVTSADIELIRHCTQMGTPVAILSAKDWIYLVEANRPPRLYFLPGVFLFLDQQIEQSFRDVNLIFVEKDTKGKMLLPEFNSALTTYFKTTIVSQFTPVRSSNTLIALRRTGSPDPCRF